MTTDPPEVLRRALDRKAGRNGPQCKSLRHRLRVRRLSRLPESEVEDRLIRMQVRLDPPDWERRCSCEWTEADRRSRDQAVERRRRSRRAA